jgi:DNA polymerase III subunit epsilon
MAARRTLILFTGLAAACFAAGWGAVWLALPAGGAGAAPYAGGAAAAFAALAGWAVVARLVEAPAGRLARRLRAMVESRSVDTDLPVERAHLLGELPERVDALVTELRSARREARKLARTEAQRVDAQKGWLEAILQSLAEGVFVCNRQHRIMLYNDAAVRLLEQPDRIGLGRNLGDVLALAPLRHSLRRLEARQAADREAAPELTAPFVCTSADRERMFHGRMALISDPGGGAGGYLVTLVDISEVVETLAKGDAVRRALNRDMRGMVGNLRAAAETVAAYPEMDRTDRQAFQKVVLDESERLSATLDELGRELQGHILGRWPMADIYATDLVQCLEQNLADGSGISVTLVGFPLWLHGDSHSLIQALEGLVRRIHAFSGAAVFDLEPLLGDKRVYLDLVWEGRPVPAGVLESWMEMPCSDEPGGQRLRDVLERHGSEPWSKASERPGHAVLRLPLLAPGRPQFEPARKRLPPRPEFYDFGLMRLHQGDAALARTPLRDIEYVVFDCEMTGLQPMQGDEVIQIAAVRVVQGRLLTGESFERLVNPGRPIPPASIKFHGLTDADVAGKPPLREVLPEFSAFVGDSVLVGHNAAFDMTFITLKQREAGVRFDNPMLDTMLISSMLDGAEDDHSLDALCDRYGIVIAGRHTAFGDTLGTAELLLKLIERLEAQGLTTFGEVMKASNMAAELRYRGARVAHGVGG